MFKYNKKLLIPNKSIPKVAKWSLKDVDVI